jgi:hypothetical protein
VLLQKCFSTSTLPSAHHVLVALKCVQLLSCVCVPHLSRVGNKGTAAMFSKAVLPAALWLLQKGRLGHQYTFLSTLLHTLLIQRTLHVLS